MENIAAAALRLGIALCLATALACSLMDTSQVGLEAQARASLWRDAALVAAGVLCACWLLGRRLRLLPVMLTSEVPQHEGLCVPVWVNNNQVHFRLTGACTGFFRKARRIAGLPLVWLVGPEFHGFIREFKVLSTEGKTGRLN
jgi:hypothetical protein